jgi:hypothetical protein
MARFSLLVSTAFLLLAAPAPCLAQSEEKVPLDKVPKQVLAAVTAKFPKATLIGATREMADGKTTYEIGLTVDKQNLHALVTAEGKLTEIHREIEAKELPPKVAKAVEAKYPNAKWEGVEQQSNAEGMAIGFEVVVEVSRGQFVEVQLDANGAIRKETKLEPKK